MLQPTARFGPVVLAILLVGSPPTTAQAGDPLRPPLDIPFIDFVPEIEDFADMTIPPHLEGKLAHVDGFVQRTPYDGALPSQPTEVYLGYDRKNLYAIFVAFDSEPDKIRANLSPRGSVQDDDSVNIMIDTFNDRRRAYVFLSTPRGIQSDGRYTEGGGFDFNFQAVWRSEARTTDRGYIVKITIPFVSLRFPRAEEQTWRVIFNRMIPRYSEDSYWPRYTLAIEGRLNQTAPLTGIRDISPGRNIQLVPYGFYRDFRVEDSGTGGTQQVDDDSEEATGLDAKFVLKDALVLDVTANPDFSQVESDQPQVTVNERFEVFFPEKRPFFLENADAFSTPTNLVFTRRIVDPSGGVKLSGKQGRYEVGALLMDDEAPGKDPEAPPELQGERAKIGVLRLSRDVGAQSELGLLLTDRELGDGYNRVGAVDGRIRHDDHWTTTFQVAAAGTRTTEGEDHDGVSYNVWLNREGPHYTNHTHYLYTSPGFRTDLGFLGGMQRPDSQNLHHSSNYRFRSESSKLTEWGPSLAVQRVLDSSGQGLDWSVEPWIEWRWAGNTAITVSYNHFEERLLPAEFDSLSAPKDFSQDRWSVDVGTERFLRFGFDVGIDLGTRINFVPPEGQAPELEDLLAVEVNAFWRPIPPLRLDFTYFRTGLDNRNASGRIFTNSIGRVRANWQFTKELSLRLITEYEKTDPVTGETSLTEDERLTGDVLVRYLWNPWWVLNVGYTSSSRDFQELDRPSGMPLDRSQDGRQFFVKFSYLFQL